MARDVPQYAWETCRQSDCGEMASRYHPVLTPTKNYIASVNTAARVKDMIFELGQIQGNNFELPPSNQTTTTAATLHAYSLRPCKLLTIFPCL